jgi:hypothetical protein
MFGVKHRSGHRSESSRLALFGYFAQRFKVAYRQ